jgi:hypothetical protein
MRRNQSQTHLSLSGGGCDTHQISRKLWGSSLPMLPRPYRCRSTGRASQRSGISVIMDIDVPPAKFSATELSKMEERGNEHP